jgi:hypothetical protein
MLARLKLAKTVAVEIDEPTIALCWRGLLAIFATFSKVGEIGAEKS